MSDALNPDYYKFSNGVELIDISENLTSNAGQAIQYIARASRLDGANKGSQVEDIEKAIWFCRRELKRLGEERLSRNPETVARLREALTQPGDAVAAPVEAPVARVFNVGDPEPADKETIKLSGYCEEIDVHVLLEYGDLGHQVRGHKLWWGLASDADDRTNGAWDYWLAVFGPLTEVEGTPASEPREFKCIEDIPEDVNEVRDVEGDYWERDGVDNPLNWPCVEDGDDKYAPFTEVL